MWQRRLILAGKISLAACLLSWLALSGRLHTQRLLSIQWNAWVVCLFALVAGSMFIPVLRWWWLLRIQGVHEPFRKILKLTWAGYLTALVLPGAASGDLAKTYLILRRRNQKRARALSTVLADRFLGLYGLLCVGGLSIIWIVADGRLEHGVRPLVAAILVPLLTMTLSVLALLSNGSRQIFFRFLPARWREAWDQSFDLYFAGLPHVFGCFGLSILSSLMTFASLVIAGRLVGQSISWADAFIAGPLVVLVNCLPITPGGIGLAETASSELFARMGTWGGAELMLVTRLCGGLISLLGVLPFFASDEYRERPTSDEVRDGEIPDIAFSNADSNEGLPGLLHASRE